MGTLLSLSKSASSFWLDVSEIALLIFGVVLVIGLVGEVAKSERWKRWLRLFELMVIVGVAGELIGDGGIFLFSRHLQTISEAEFAVLNKQAAEVYKEAATVRKEADSFELDIARARKGAADALERAAKAEENLGKARKYAAVANERAANAEKETAILKQRFADRTLTDAQVAAIAGKLRPFAGQEFDVTPYWELKESMAIANRIANALSLAGWKYTPPKQPGFLLGGRVAVLVYIHPAATEETKKAADSLVSALNEQGIASEIRQQSPANPIDNRLHLVIGTKP
jgi:hypothetical protein